MVGQNAEPFLGIMMLATRFPRMAGDIGNPASHPYPVRYRTVDTATVDAIVTPGGIAPAVVADFIDAARALEREGARALTTSCGFLVQSQAALADAVEIPLLTSSLCLYADVRARTGGAPIGILTANAAALTETALRAAGIDPDDVCVEGMETCPAFAGSVLADDPAPLDQPAIAAGAVAAVERLKRRRPDIGALIVECTNLPPYREAIVRAAGVPVYDCHDVGRRLMM